MKSEQLIAKKVKHHFDQKLKQVLFDVNSLEEHYDGLLIHKSDIVYLEEGELVNGYVKVGDVNMDDAVSKEVVEYPKETEMSFEEAEQLVNTGHLIALPEWKGFWFKNLKTNELLVLTKEGVITNTPFDEFKERNDWKIVNPTEEQAELLEDYWESFEKSLKENTKTPESVLEIEVNAETLELNPEFVEAGIKVGETIAVDAVEPISEVAKKIEGSRIVKADYVFAAMPTEEIIPAKVVKKKKK